MISPPSVSQRVMDAVMGKAGQLTDDADELSSMLPWRGPKIRHINNEVRPSVHVPCVCLFHVVGALAGRGTALLEWAAVSLCCERLLKCAR